MITDFENADNVQSPDKFIFANNHSIEAHISLK